MNLERALKSQLALFTPCTVIAFRSTSCTRSQCGYLSTWAAVNLR